MALVFDNAFVQGHVLATRFLSDLDTLCKRDYKGVEYFHKTIDCLDMDAYESSLSGDNDATMDASIGVATYENNRVSDCRHLLVELRFKYKSTDNFKVENMRQKVSHTKDLLCGDRVHHEMIFLYTDDIAPKACGYFSRLSKQYHEIACWKAMSVGEFLGFVRDRSSFPYQPINNLIQIENDLGKKFQSNGFAGLIALIDYWIGEIEKYSLRYNREESKAIAEVILNFLNQQPASGDSIMDEYVNAYKESLKGYSRM